MKNTFKFLLFAVFTIVLANTAAAQTVKYKCMIQTQNYTGREAYVAVSLMNPKGEYEKTLAILGDNLEWYNTLEEWDKFRTKKSEKLNAVTSASVAPGARATRVLELETEKIDKGYTIRFESSVENMEYFVQDAAMPLTTEALENKAGITGSGHIKLIRFIKAQQ